MRDVEIRPMREEDVVDADRVCAEVLYTSFDGEQEAVRAARQHARIRHLLRTDPGGSWVAEHDGRVEGVGLSLIREGVWGFSLFGVATALQGRGVGRALFARCWEYGEGARGRIVLSSTNAQAMGIYAHTGLPIRPCVAAAGIPDLERAPDVDDVVDAGEAGIAVADAIGRELRGAGHGRDLPVPMAHGARLLVFEDRAFAVARASNLIMLGARDAQARPARAVGRARHLRSGGDDQRRLPHRRPGLGPAGVPGRPAVAVARRTDVRRRDAGPAGPLHPEWRLPLGGPGARLPRGPPYIPSGAYL